MRIEYVCHACLLIETEDLRIATDPWFAGPAFCGQWHVFPKPVNQEKLNDVDAILISHGHEDHLHEPTMRLLPKTAKVYYPYAFFGGAKEYIEGLGFGNVTEAVTLKRYKVSPQTAVTFIVNGHDSLMVIESGGEVLVNANDALHSSPEKVIDFYIGLIREKWEKIDYLFCGFGGASHFPNTIHVDGKNDWECGVVREQLFAHNFCRIASGLNARIAVPFAADFALLSDHQRWINRARFPRQKMADYFARYFPQNGVGPKIHDMYSGDALEGAELKMLSPYRAELANGGTSRLVDRQYDEVIAAARRTTFIDDTEGQKLAEEIRRNVARRRTLFHPEKLKGLKFCVRITDLENDNCFNIDAEPTSVIVVRGDVPAPDRILTMNLSSKILRYSISSDWGADVICVGYGADIEFTASGLDSVDKERICISLLARYPTVSDLKKKPIRILSFLLLNPPRFTRSIRKLKRFHDESDNYDCKTWLLKDIKDIRNTYGLPELDPEFIPPLP
ncbi:MAG: MBL fold metallo-hydrolase [Pyrinomonadaceae bacterium]